MPTPPKDPRYNGLKAHIEVGHVTRLSELFTLVSRHMVATDLHMGAMQIGIWLKEKRQEKGLSQLELADKMWIRHETVSKVESGKWAISIDMLTLFCHHLGIPLKKMFE